ncbi:MAG: hypothetical protein ACREN7_09865 [Candidatus Dormibacteria bacterium]
MATGTEQARAAVAATRERMGASLDRLEVRLRHDLDPRVRLRRDGLRVAAGVAVVALVLVASRVRASRRRRLAPVPEADWIASMPESWRLRLEELLVEAAQGGGMPDSVPKPARRGQRRSLTQGLAVRGAKLAAPLVISALGERLARRQGEAPT